MGIIIKFVISILCGLIATEIFELILKSNKKWKAKYYRHHEILFGYHAHHSVYGLFMFAFGAIFFIFNQKILSLIMLGIGIGIIFMHTVSERRFVFIERQKK